MLLFLVLLFYVTGKFITGHFILEIYVKFNIPLIQFRKKVFISEIFESEIKSKNRLFDMLA